jgi:hypothetical protein
MDQTSRVLSLKESGNRGDGLQATVEPRRCRYVDTPFDPYRELDQQGHAGSALSVARRLAISITSRARCDRHRHAYDVTEKL